MGCTKLRYLKIFRGLGNAGVQAERTPGLEAYLESHPESLWAGMGMITEVGGSRLEPRKTGISRGNQREHSEGVKQGRSFA